ncbi:MAG TPA: hypothetical protein VF299_10235 [Mycobacterium sp.]
MYRLPGQRGAQQLAAEAAEQIRGKTAVNLTVAAVALDVSHSTASRRVADGTFPVPFIRMGARVIVPTLPLRQLLGITAGTDAA